MKKFETLLVTTDGPVAHIELNRPEKANALSAKMWREIREAFVWLDDTEQLRVGVLSGRGKYFCSGIDFEFLIQVEAEVEQLSEGRKQERLHQWIVELQDCVSSLERCRKPVLAAIQGVCMGGGLDFASACDLRYATVDCRFSVKEVDLGIVADTGTLQRLPHLVGQGVTRELAFTGHEFDGAQGRAMGLVNEVYEDKTAMMREVMTLAASIAEKSPLTIRGIKETLNFSRDHSVEQGLAFVALRNAGMLLSADIEEALTAQVQKRKPKFED